MAWEQAAAAAQAGARVREAQVTLARSHRLRLRCWRRRIIRASRCEKKRPHEWRRHALRIAQSEYDDALKEFSDDQDLARSGDLGTHPQ